MTSERSPCSLKACPFHQQNKSSWNVILVKGAGSSAPEIEIFYPQDRHCEAARDPSFPFTGILFLTPLLSMMKG
ncbi:unnamed protein product [Caretta caretta]